QVTIELEPAARWVTEDYVCESVTELPGGRVRAVLRTPAPAWVARLMLRLGPEGHLVAPRELAEEVRAEARRALAHYRTAENSAESVDTTVSPECVRSVRRQGGGVDLRPRGKIGRPHV